MKECLVCHNPISPFMSFGKQPIANGFLTPEQFNDEYFYEMEVAFCQICFMVQLVNQPSPSQMFHENYAFYSSTSKGMARHFEHFANDVIRMYSPSFVVEIGSNDGIMLKHIANQDIRHLGVEPSENVAAMATEQGVNSISQFFSESLADKIVDENGQADVILSANVMAHISDIHEVMRGVKKLLKPDGVLIFEDPYLGDILSKVAYDQIYDEHAFYFSLSSIIFLMGLYDMEVIDVWHQDVHGGSMRYTVAHKGRFTPNECVTRLLQQESSNGLKESSTYDTFRSNVEQSRDILVDTLHSIRAKGGRIVGYAATAKSATVLNYCDIGADLIDYICDTTPIKQGKCSPGAHIPVRPYQDFKDNPPDYAILFAWNHAKEIMEKESGFMGQWIFYVPEVRVE